MPHNTHICQILALFLFLVCGRASYTTLSFTDIMPPLGSLLMAVGCRIITLLAVIFAELVLAGCLAADISAPALDAVDCELNEF